MKPDAMIKLRLKQVKKIFRKWSSDILFKFFIDRLLEKRYI